MSTITLWLAFYFVLFSEYTFLLLLVTLLQVEYNIVYEYFILGFFFKRVFMFITFGGFFGRERERKKIKSDQFILIKIGRSLLSEARTCIHNILKAVCFN